MERARRAAAFSNYGKSQSERIIMQRNLIMHQGKHFCWPVLESMCKLIVVETKVPEVDFK